MRVISMVLCALFHLHLTAAYDSKEPLSWLQLYIMKHDGVDKQVIRAFVLDAIPGVNGSQLSTLLDLLEDGKLTKDEFIDQLMGDGFDVPEELIMYLHQTNPKDALLKELTGLYGIPAIFIDILMDKQEGDDSIVRKYLVSNLVGDDISPVQKAVLEAAFKGEDITKENIISSLTAQILGQNDIYTQLGMKAIKEGNKKDGLAYLILSQTAKPSQGFYDKYPKNEALFAYFVEQTNGGKISAKTILNMALGEQIDALNPDATFLDKFGVQAHDFVCAAHHNEILLDCSATANKFLASPLECVNAGCCYRSTGCYENVLGKIGMGLASDMIDETHITTLLGEQLPELANFWPDGVIPWIPSNAIPSAAALAAALTGQEQSFLDSYKMVGNNFPTDPASIYLGLNPTKIPDIRPNARRPDFVWRPHAVTAFPHATEIPQAVIIDNNEYRFGGPPSVDAVDPVPPLIEISSQITPDIASCVATPNEDRYACMSNYEALLPTGQFACTALGCCHAPDYKDLSVTACFKDISYGQCYNVPNEDKIECGSPGITQEECVSNPRCCWDSTTTNNNFNTFPWCYYKKHSFILSNEVCARSSYSEGCFTGKFEDFNQLISETSCLNAGCCYKPRARLTYFQRLFNGPSTKTVCFKPASYTYTVLDPAPQPPATGAVADPVCKYDGNPYNRENCAASSYYACVSINGCCYKPEPLYQGAPWCFKKA